jgi:hypothetical protein
MMATPNDDLFPTVIEENESSALPFLLVGACVLFALFFWRDSTKFYGGLLAAATLLIFCFAGHRKIVVYRTRRVLEIYASRAWGDALQHTLSFDDVKDIGCKKSWGVGESNLDYKAYIKDRSGNMYLLMTGWKLDEGDAENMAESVRQALGRQAG